MGEYAVSGNTGKMSGDTLHIDGLHGIVGISKHAVPLARERTEFLIAALGSSTAVAKLLEVSRSQPGKWRRGLESPGADAARLLIDLDHVLARAMMIWDAPTARDWLTGINPFLEGARPIDVLRTRGSRDVIDALDAAMAGSFS
jgi:hypothetical protein